MSTEGNERIQFVWIGAFLAKEAPQMKSSFYSPVRARTAALLLFKLILQINNWTEKLDRINNDKEDSNIVVLGYLSLDIKSLTYRL